jgi:hypothetical protein
MAYSNYSGRYGGDPIVHPCVGEYVEVKPGKLFAGSRLKVLDVRGYLYSIGYRIYVAAPDGIETWYWPWDVIVSDPETL